MKTNVYKNDHYHFTSYLKPIGKSFEIGFIYEKKPIFLGTFNRSKEANHWYNQMKKDIRNFSTRYKIGPSFPISWFKHFLSSHLYKTYYTYQEKNVRRHTKTYNREFKRDEKIYKKLNKKWHPKEKIAYLKAA